MISRKSTLTALLLCAQLVWPQQQRTQDHQLATRMALATNVVTLPSASPLFEIKIMVRAGSVDDPPGKEGLANLAAQALIEGGFGDPKNPVTKERLAEITRPWGDLALPRVLVDKETTTFSVTVPRDAFSEFIGRVLQPMLNQPLFLPAELDRLRKEALVDIESRLRFEEQELLGLLALDDWLLGGRYGHLARGTVAGLKAITQQDLKDFYGHHYSQENIFVATTIPEQGEQAQLLSALPKLRAAASEPGVSTAGPRQALSGHHLLIITQPNAIATGIHLGFPVKLKHGDPDYWPLFIGNVFLGTHRDSFGRLYREIREERGYNYGDYSYIEYLHDRPYALFPPPTTPRSEQYFSIWVRPVGHQYTHFIVKAATAELEQFIAKGLTPEQVTEAKVKARTLYLKFAENRARQIGYGLDDLFYGTREHGYLPDMLKSIDGVTPTQVNAAIKKYLQVKDIAYVIVTNESMGAKLADDIAAGANVVSKTPAEYHLTEPIPSEKQKMLAQDKEWAAYPLNIPRANIVVVKAAQMFETAGTPGEGPPATAPSK